MQTAEEFEATFKLTQLSPVHWLTPILQLQSFSIYSAFFDVLPNFLFTTSEMMCNVNEMYIRAAVREI